MNYQDISKVNSEMTMLDLKGKNYAMVPERVTAFRKLFPEGFIITNVISNDGTTVMMQATVGYYKENGEAVTLATGFAQEVKGRGMVNGTSHIENCETSAVGRALGMIGLGINGGGICSAEELANAIVAQGQMKQAKPAEKPAGQPEKADVVKAARIPENPVANYIRNEIADIQQASGGDYASTRKAVMDIAATLVEGGAIPPFEWKSITMEEAKNVFAAVRKMLPEGGKK